MSVVTWTIERWKDLFEIGGTAFALLFTGVALHIDSRVRRAETLIEITKQHRELWMYFDEHRELAGLFDAERNVTVRPLSNAEVRFINFLLNHLRATFYARSARIYAQPECLREDIRGFFSLPAPRAAWSKLKQSHDSKFIAFVERNLAGE